MIVPSASTTVRLTTQSFMVPYLTALVPLGDVSVGRNVCYKFILGNNSWVVSMLTAILHTSGLFQGH